MRDAQHPVSAVLEQKLLTALNDKKIVVWLDVDGAFTGFVDSIRHRAEVKDFPAPVVPFRGSFLELMLALENEGSTVDKPLLVVHLPGFNVQSVRSTPVLELYECSLPFQPNLETLVREAANGRRPLSEIDAFVANKGLSLPSADFWLSQAGAAGGDTQAKWVSTLDAPALVHQLVASPADQLKEGEHALRARAEILFGTDAPWYEFIPDTIEAIVGWLLCVEYVDDLQRPPLLAALSRLRSLPKETVKRCRAEAARLRETYPDRYRSWALSLETRLLPTEQTNPRDLGRIDTFRFEEICIYQGAVQALANGDDARALEWAVAREGTNGFWVQQEQPRRWAWMLVAEAARLGVALSGAARPLAGVASLDEAVSRYVAAGAMVDRDHRHFEQRFSALNGPQLPNLTELLQAFDALRQRYRVWSDQLAKDFATICRTAGPLPPAELQQRNVFNDVVMPLLATGERVALIMLDAMRYEMALELRDELSSSGVHVDLRARLAELPTVTSIGMNALAPLSRGGLLTPVMKAGRFQGFRAGEALVSRPDDRVRAMGVRSGGRPPLRLEVGEISSTPPARLKHQIAQAQLIVVHGLELDEAGEAGFGVRLFEDVLRNVVAACRHLEAAGVQHFVLTSDHGFLLQDQTVHPRPFGARGEADRRYVFTTTDRGESGYLSLPLTACGYDAERTGFLLFREDTHDYDVGRPVGTFTHGGNSLQERVVPVLQVSSKRVIVDATLTFAIDCETAPPAMGVQRLRLRVKSVRSADQEAMDFAVTRPVDIALHVPGHENVQVVVKDVTGGGATARAGGVRAQAGTSDWTEVYFALEGPDDAKLPVQLTLVGSKGDPVVPDSLYPVTVGGSVSPSKSFAVPQAEGGWGARLSDEDAGRVFDYLEQHGNLNEADLVALLGSARKARSFAARFEGFREKVTFEVQVSMGVDGKRYERI